MIKGEHVSTPFDSVLYRQELIQSYLRTLFIFILYLFSHNIYVFVADNTNILVDEAVVYTALFLVISIMHLILLKKYPHLHTTLRKYIMLLMDVLAITLAIFVLDNNGVIFNPLYVWVILGYGIRFGKRFLLASILLTYLAIIVLSQYHTLWLLYPEITYALIAAVTIIPLFVLQLLNEIKRKNIELEVLLEKTEHLANHDVLTTLPNRHYFYKKLDESMKKEDPFFLLFFDLDGFKEVNDYFGHEIGDNVLKGVGIRLDTFFGKENFVARLGGDEFVCIHIDADKQKIIQSIENLLSELIQPYTEDISGLSVSVGASQYPYDSRDNFELKNFADKAMYEAKRNGKNQLVLYSSLS